MTIAQAFNEITIAQGGTPNAGGTIAGAIDALNDTLAGSDQKPAQTIEGAIRLLGAHIGGGVAPSGTIEITENGEGIDVAEYAYADVNVSGGGGDLTTATATITVASQGNIVNENLVVCRDDEDVQGIFSIAGMLAQGTQSLTLALYKGKQYYLPNNAISNLSGNIEGDEGGYVITGDCSFTLTSSGGGFPGL